MAELTLDDISFLQGQDADSIHKEMLESLPDALDKTEGGFADDFTRPTALRMAKFAEQDILNAISCIFPETSFGDFLDRHGKTRGIVRKEATKAYGHVQVTAKAGTEIPVGTVFTTIADDYAVYVEFVSVTSGITESDTEPIDLAVEAVVAGIEGNVPAGAIALLGTNLKNVSSVINAEATTGGTDIEDDDSLRKRIDLYDKNRQVSYVGSKADYVRWALEVPGVGSAVCIPAQDTSGLVTLIITDANGDAANEQLCSDVYEYIQSPSDEYARKTNVNATLSVIPPATLDLTISATVELVYTGTLESVKSAFVSALKLYLSSCEGEVKYSKVWSTLSSTPGISDLNNLLINGGTSNIAIGVDKLPNVTSVTLTKGVVE
ncbi:MAG: baseplate J/gp47 family protein [Peptococcaceae bacterium]|nr:baseplate J/gp47 family protein [Peptococcaceae bacterium]